MGNALSIEPSRGLMRTYSFNSRVVYNLSKAETQVIVLFCALFGLTFDYPAVNRV